MRSPFFVAAALAARAIAQVPLQINTPGGANTANECQPCLITWSGGTPPYFIVSLLHVTFSSSGAKSSS
ncbi:hypothetical protein B0H11DRAFT_2278935 [Mycena galericulata]|nr:hypothetical protein B0H11DRAFT_2278935 [Mycena galericulata]